MVIKKRSPNYPGIDLEEAVQVTATLYQGVSRGEFTPTDATKAWGYNSASGPVKIRLAALRQYGLIEGKKGENPRLSKRALTLVLRNQSSREYQQALREAALEPGLFAELYESMPDAAPDAMRQHLIVERTFTDEGANRVSEVFRATIALANFPKSSKLTGQNQGELDGSRDEDEEIPPTLPPGPHAPLSQGSLTIPVPFSENKIGMLTLPLEMTDQDWKKLDRILLGYRPESEEGAKDARIAASAEEGNQ